MRKRCSKVIRIWCKQIFFWVAIQSVCLTSCSILFENQVLFFDASERSIDNVKSSFELARASFVECKGKRIATRSHVQRMVEHELKSILMDSNISVPVSGTTSIASAWSAVRLRNGKVFICGGSLSNNKPLMQTYIYDPQSKKCLPTSELKAATCEPDLILLQDGRVLITGGLGVESHMPLSACQIYDPGSKRVEVCGLLNTPRYQHATIQLNTNQVFIVGGRTVSSHGENLKPTPDVELLELNRKRCTRAGKMSVALWAPTLIAMNTTSALVVGGWYEMDNLFKDVRWNRNSETISLKPFYF